MPKFDVKRTTYYRQHSTVRVEAKDAWEAFEKAREEDDPEFDWEQVERADFYDRLGGATKVEVKR